MDKVRNSFCIWHWRYTTWKGGRSYSINSHKKSYLFASGREMHMYLQTTYSFYTHLLLRLFLSWQVENTCKRKLQSNYHLVDKPINLQFHSMTYHLQWHQLFCNHKESLDLQKKLLATLNIDPLSPEHIHLDPIVIKLSNWDIFSANFLW